MLEQAGIAPRYVAKKHTAAEVYLNGSDKQRCSELVRELSSPKNDAVWFVRGGYGVTRLFLDLDKCKLCPSATVIGYSDATALFSYLWKKYKLKSLHAPVVTELSRLNTIDKQVLFEAIDNKWRAYPVTLLKNKTENKISGRLFPFNLTMLVTLLGTPYLPNFSGSILCLEEVNEKSYSIDRMLTQISQSGILNRVKGIIFGHITGSEISKRKIYAFMANKLSHLGAPIFGNLSCGHEAPNLPLQFGGKYYIQNNLLVRGE